MAKTTYLCGGINGLSDANCRDWRELAKTQLKTETLDPMRRDYRGLESECWREIVAYDLEDIDVCDFVLVNATKPSWGTAMEVFYAATAHSIPVIAWVGRDGMSRVSPWLRYHCHEIHESLEDAINSINACAVIGQRSDEVSTGR
jgi:nucleoside 2-deoxyribosyltransferase